MLHYSRRVCSDVSSHILLKSRGNIKEYVCKKGSVYETQLKEDLDELGEAQTIINILQKELLTSMSTKNLHGNDLVSTEGFVDTKLRRKKIKCNTRENNNILKLQQSQPILVVVNKYAPLDSLQDKP